MKANGCISLEKKEAADESYITPAWYRACNTVCCMVRCKASQGHHQPQALRTSNGQLVVVLHCIDGNAAVPVSSMDICWAFAVFWAMRTWMLSTLMAAKQRKQGRTLMM